MFSPKMPSCHEDVPAYQQAVYLRHLDELTAHGVPSPTARVHARAAAWRAADLAKDRIEKSRPTPHPRGTPAMHIFPGHEAPKPAAKPDDKKAAEKKPEAKKTESVFHYRMDELSKAKEALHLAADVMDDEHQIAKIKKAEKLAKEVRAEEKKKGPAPEAPKSAEAAKKPAK